MAMRDYRKHPRWAAILEANLQAHWARTKNLMLVTLGLWISYFMVVHFFILKLNRIIVPVIELPLGLYLAVQGSLVVFIVMLFWFGKKQS
jgi:putative solute:sodium symporter small subunit